MKVPSRAGALQFSSWNNADKKSNFVHLLNMITTYSYQFYGHLYKSMYSRVPNNSAARLLIFLNFSLPTRLIWTYTLIKFHEKILPTRLLCTTFYFFYLVFMLFTVFFHCNCSNNATFMCFHPYISVKGWKKCVKLHLKNAYTFITYWDIPTYTVIRTYTLIRFQDYFPPTLLFGLHAYSAP